MADLRKTNVVYIMHMYVMCIIYVTLRWEAVILLCENLQFGASLHFHMMSVGLWLLVMRL